MVILQRNPRQQELEAVSFIKSEMKDVLQVSILGKELVSLEMVSPGEDVFYSFNL